MKIENPHYYLKLNMEGCPRMVSINGIEIERDFGGSSNFSEYPVNHFIRNGQNSFEIAVPNKEYISENFPEMGACRVELLVRGLHQSEKVEYKISDISFENNFSDPPSTLTSKSMRDGNYLLEENGKIERAEGKHDFSTGPVVKVSNYYEGIGTTLQRTFTTQVDFPEWAFFSSEKVFTLPFDDEEYDSSHATMMTEAKKIWNVFSTKDLSKILPLFEGRSKEIDTAFYKEAGTTQKELRASLENVFKNNFPLSELDEDYLELLVSHDGRLVTLVDAGNMAGTMYFKDTKTDSFTFYTIYWAKKDGKWFIAR